MYYYSDMVILIVYDVYSCVLSIKYKWRVANNAVIHECLLWHEWIIIAVCLQVIYFWYSEYKRCYTVYYIEFTLLLGLISDVKMTNRMMHTAQQNSASLHTTCCSQLLNN